VKNPLCTKESWSSMAITPKGDEGTNLDLVFSNGDLQVLKQLRDEWGFKDEASVLLYALAVMAKATTKTLYVEEIAGGEKKGLTPSTSVLREAEPDASNK
jgi:hypothetical protein